MAVFQILKNRQPFSRGDIDSFGFNGEKIKLFYKAGIFQKHPHPTQQQYTVNEEVFK